MSVKHRLLLHELRATLTLAFPIIVGQVSQMLMGLTDSVMIGRVGVVPLAASAFAGTIFNFVYITALGLLIAVSVLGSRAHGARQPRECAEYLRHGMALALGLGIGVVGTLLGFAAHLHWLGPPTEVLAEVNPFFCLIAVSLLPVLVFQVLKQFSEAVGHPWAPMAILLAGVALNALLNWVLIYGHLGAPALGLTGSGLATLIARLASAVVLWWWLGRHPGVRAEWPEKWRGALSVGRLGGMLRIGVPAAGQWLFEAGAFSAAALMMGWLGTVPLAAHQIALGCASFAFMFPLGLSIATSVRLSRALGGGQRDAVRAIGFGSLGAGLVVMTGFALLFALGGRWIATGFTPDAEVVTLATKLLVVAAMFQLFDGAQVIGSGALRGLSDVRVPTAITFVAYWVVSLPTGYLLAFRTSLGSVGVWSGLAVGLCCAAVLLGWRFHRLTLRR